MVVKQLRVETDLHCSNSAWHMMPEHSLHIPPVADGSSWHGRPCLLAALPQM